MTILQAIQEGGAAGAGVLGFVGVILWLANMDAAGAMFAGSLVSVAVAVGARLLDGGRK